MSWNCEENVLYVRMFGGFSMSWNQVLITGGGKSSKSQFSYLMQLLLHFREKGISRDRLEEILFGDRDLGDVHHALRTVAYNAKKRLQECGLPEGAYIKQKKGIYYWTGQILVEEDTEQFEVLAQKAEEEEDPVQKAEYYLDACSWYTGGFLPAQTDMAWAAQEARRYHALFCKCVENAAALLREQREFRRMEELGIYAAKADPLTDWEAITMEALVAMGRYEDARKLYDNTAELYFREQGLYPSGKMMEFMQKMGEKIEHRYAVLEEIQASLTGNRQEEYGGYLCSYPVFQGIYRMMSRQVERGGQSVCLMLCTIIDSKGRPVKDGAVLDSLSRRLEEAIRYSVRHGDVICHYGKGQYLILLSNTTHESCRIVQRRINSRFLTGNQKAGVHYSVSSVYGT